MNDAEKAALIARVLRGPGQVSRIFAMLTDEQLRAPLAPGEWSPAEVLAHLRERVLLARERDAGDARASNFGKIDREAAPAATDIQHAAARRDHELGGEHPAPSGSGSANDGRPRDGVRGHMAEPTRVTAASPPGPGPSWS